jgi:hypothetical protein
MPDFHPECWGNKILWTFGEYCDGICPFATQQVGKHWLKAGIIAEAEVIFAR